jgi:CRP/FNR family transcriptional regulator, dissimilatory nitrate respiration regulator
MIQAPLISALMNACSSNRLPHVRHTYRAGRIISDNPDGVCSVGLVISGCVDVYSVALDGHDIHLSTLDSGKCFGISNLLAGNELKTVLRCAQRTEILYLPKQSLLEAMQTDANLTLLYAEYCNQKLQFLIDRIELLTTNSGRRKCIVYLLSQQDGNGDVHLRGSREDLARKLGISRSALFRELSYLQQQGAVRANGDQTLSILDPVLLETLVESPNQRVCV